MHHHRHSPQDPTAVQTPKRLLPLLLVAQLMVILDITAVNIAMPSLARDLQHQRRDDQLDDHRLFARLRQPAAARRPRRRPARPPAHVPHRPRHLHGLVARVGDGGFGGRALRFPRRPGPRRRDAVPGSPFDHHQQLPRPGTREGARGLGRGRRRRRRARRPRRRRAYRGRRLAADLLRQPARRRGTRLRRPQDRARRHGQAALARPRRPGAVLATGSLAAIVYAITQADSAGWISGQTLGIGGVGIAGLAAFAVCELRTAQPLLRIDRLRDRAVGGGLLLALVNAGLMFGLFLLCSLYLQLALGRGPLPDRPRVHPARARRRNRLPRRRPPHQPARRSAGQPPRRSLLAAGGLLLLLSTSPLTAATCATCCRGC